MTRLLAAVCLTVACAAAQADIYGYLDGDGVAHFSTEKLDERYQLFLRGGTSFDSAQFDASDASAASPVSLPLLDYLARHPNLKKYEPLLNQAAQEFALDPALLKAVMAAESGFNPAAVSPKGAIGLMQVMPATAERYGLQGDRSRTVTQKLTDPKTNIRLAARYLRDLHRLFPAHPELVIASYNAGERAVQKYDNRIPPYPETRSYVQIVKQLYRVYRPAAQTLAIAAFPPMQPRRIHMTIPGRRDTASIATLSDAR